jgi:hypothetical protein
VYWACTTCWAQRIATTALNEVHVERIWATGCFVSAQCAFSVGDVVGVKTQEANRVLEERDIHTRRVRLIAGALAAGHLCPTADTGLVLRTVANSHYGPDSGQKHRVQGTARGRIEESTAALILL